MKGKGKTGQVFRLAKGAAGRVIIISMPEKAAILINTRTLILQQFYELLTPYVGFKGP